MENILYLPLDKKEKWIGWLVAAVYIGAFLILGLQHWVILWLLSLLTLPVFLFVFRKFVWETVINVPLLGKKVWLRPVFAALVNLIVCTVFNDILMLYQLPFFVGTQWGPALWDIRAYFVSQSQPLWFAVLGLVLILPCVEELIFRQLVFSTIFPKSRILALIVSVLLFSAFHIVPFIGTMQNMGDSWTFYLFAYSFQFVPMGLLACWLYLSTDSIISPILMHMLCNTLVVYTACNY